jgi:MFS family permease
MGNLFSSRTEDILLYVVIPAVMLVFVVGMLLAERRVREHLRRHERSWHGAVVSEDTAFFRNQAARLGRAPAEVVVLIRVLLAWATGVGIFWCCWLVFLALTLRGWWVLAFVVILCLGMGMGASTSAAELALAMGNRDDRETRPKIARVRRWLLIHHGAVLLIGTGLLFLFVLSNQFFWNGASDHRVAQLIRFAVLYAIVILVPTVLAALLAQRLGRVASLYPEAPALIRPDPTPS